MHLKNLEDWLTYLQANPVGSRHSEMSSPERCRIILDRLGFQKFCPLISVAGTNGKGSSCHLLAHYLQEGGKRVGLFTSPHLRFFNERIAINGIFAHSDEIVVAFSTIQEAADGFALGYFDYAFLAALLIFKQHHVDYMILEVGLGGRLDAVNSLSADLAIITRIGLDHTEILGETYQEIALEKAGIFRSAPQVAISGDADSAADLMNYAAVKDIQLYVRGRDFDFLETASSGWSAKMPFGDIQNLPFPSIPLDNALTILFAAQMLDKLQLSPFYLDHFKQALCSTQVPGRMQRLQMHPEIILDVAHNPQSAAYLNQYLQVHPIDGKTYMVFSALQEKDIAGMLQPFVDWVDAWFILPLDHARAASLSQIQACLRGSVCFSFDRFSELYQAIQAYAHSHDRIVIWGSFALVAEALSVL